MAIEQLGESLLSQARDRKKKEKKKAKIFTGLMLGVQLGNVALRKRAEKRANEFWASNKGVLDQRATQFQQGVNFWDNHNKLMSSKGVVGGGDWKDAYKEEQYAVYKARDLGGNKPKDLIKFKQDVDFKIQDDLKSYEQKLEIYKNFKNIPTTGREQSKTAYVKTLRDKLEKSASTITKNDNVGNFLLSQVGIRKKPSVEATTILGGEAIITAGGLSKEERNQLLEEFKQANLLDKDLAEANAQSQYQPMSEEEIKKYLPEGSTSVKPIGSHQTSFGLALSENDVKRQESLLNEYRFTYNGKENQTPRNIYETIFKNQGVEAAEVFRGDVLTISRKTQLDYEKTNVGKEVVNAEVFLNQAIREVIGETPSEINNDWLTSTIKITNNTTNDSSDVRVGTLVNLFKETVDEDKEKAKKQLEVYKNNYQNLHPEFIKNIEDYYNNAFPENKRSFKRRPIRTLPYGAG
jgi:hypothetical protein|tara:strand:+ start:2642 stop:4033 length:1392 start_codon:yes stop_codon:yes gene_type:complete